MHARTHAHSSLSPACGSLALFPLFINELICDIRNKVRHGIQFSIDFIKLFILLFADDVAVFSDPVVGLQY